jgi:hypothetical protein
MSVFCGDLTFQIREDDRGFKVGDWVDLKRLDHNGADCPMFATDGVEVQLWLKITAIIRGDQFAVPGRATPADLQHITPAIIPPVRPLDPRYVVLALKRL